MGTGQREGEKERERERKRDRVRGKQGGWEIRGKERECVCVCERDIERERGSSWAGRVPACHLVARYKRSGRGRRQALRSGLLT